MYSIVKDGITKSLLSLYLHCGKAFYYRTQLLLAKKPDLKMIVGIYGHKMLEIGKLPSVKEGKFVQIVTHGILKVIIPAYHLYWGASKGQKEYIFDVSHNGIRMRGKIDKIDKSITDYKFKARFDNEEGKIANSIDGLFYCTAMNKRVFTLDCLKVPALKFDKVPDFEKYANDIQNNPGDFFIRPNAEYTEDDISLFSSELDEYHKQINSKNFTRNLSACWHCDYLKLCITGDKSGLCKQNLFTELEE